MRLVAPCTAFLLMASVPAAQQKAFPEAEGFGAHARGGRGGRVLLVTSLADSGRGSLRAALQAEGPRTVIFRVSGVIPLESTLEITEPRVTVAGQSAPGDGIGIKNHCVTIATHDVILRHLRIRPGDEARPAFERRGEPFAPDGLNITAGSRDVIIDHCSVGWGIDECLSVSGEGITEVTVQWCLISESLNEGPDGEGPHGYGSLLRCNGNVTFHHNIYAHHHSRSPRPGTYGEGSILLDFRNNVIYDSTGYSADDPVRMNYVGNFIKRPRGAVFRIGGDATRMYVAGNHLEGGGAGNRDNWLLIAGAEPHHARQAAFPAAAVATDPARQAYRRALERAGATLPQRDAVDARIIEQIREGTGGLIGSQRDMGGWPELASSAPPQDGDGDGLPDAWERRHGLDPETPDGGGDADGDGYTNLEEWLNGTDPQAGTGG